MSRKRRENKKLYQRRRKARQPVDVQPRPEPLASSLLRHRPAPSEFDQMSVFIDEAALGLPVTTLAGLRDLARTLPFESAMLNLALLNLRAERVLNDPAGQASLASWFYATWPDLLALRAGQTALARAADLLASADRDAYARGDRRGP